MRTKKKEPNSRKNTSVKINAHSRTSRLTTARGRIRSIKTAFANKPMFDPIAGP